MTALLQVRGVSKTYGQIRALTDIDLEVPAGGIFGIVGPNGAGKTTLFSILCGFLGADKGEVIVAGNVVRPNHPPPGGMLTILPQDARFLPSVPLGKQLRFYAELTGLDRRAAETEVRRVLEMVGLPEVYGRLGSTLSHGMYKRVGIAQAFIGSPRVIILDEPTAGLDPHAAREIHHQLRSITSSQTVIVSSHNLSEIEDLCNAVAILKQGRVARVSTMESLLSQATEVSFRLAEEPKADLISALEGLPYVTGARWDKGAGRLRVDINTATLPADEAGGELVKFFVGRNVKFMDLQVGANLEERFIRETR
jgi:ABC-2 type transport system ATP-binding protein